MQYQGHTTLITGASSGLGEEFARQLAMRGACDHWCWTLHLVYQSNWQAKSPEFYRNGKPSWHAPTIWDSPIHGAV